MEEQNTQLSQVSNSIDQDNIFGSSEDGLVKVIFQSSPLDDPEYSVVDPGFKIGDAVYHYAKDRIAYATVYVNDKFVDTKDWSYELNPDDVLRITISLEDPVSAAIATISWVTVGVTALVVGAGLVIGYFLFKPDDPDDADPSRLNSIRGIRNGMRRYDPHRIVLGKRQIAPDYLAESYTFRRGNDEWMKCLFAVGYGPLDLDFNSFKIGETPLIDYEHSVEYVDWYNRSDIAPLKDLWPSDVVEEQLGVTLKQGDEYPQTTATETDKISLEFMLPRGLTSSRRGSRGNGRGVTIGHEYVCPDTGKRVKVARIRYTGLDSIFSNNGRPNALNLVRMDDGSYRVTIRQRLNRSRYPWDHMSSWINASSQRHIKLRSYTFPSEAIIAIRNGYAYIDPDILDGTPRTLDVRVRVDGGWTIATQNAGTWSSNDWLGAVSPYGDSSRQRRFGFEYTPISASTGQPVSGNIQTYTYKIWPTESPDTAQLIDEVQLTKFRSIRDYGPGGFERLIGLGEKPPLRYRDDQDNLVTVENFKPVVIALDIKATDQLSGTLDSFNLMATSVVPSDWESDWRDWPSHDMTPSENPAELYRWMLQGPFTDAPLGNSRVNKDSLLDWKNTCNLPAPEDNTGSPVYSGPQWRCSFEILEEKTIRETLQQIAFTGRAEFTYDVDSGYSVVQKIRQDDYPVEIFTPKNSWDFGSSRSFPERVDGIRFEFDNENNQYQQDEDYFYDPRLDEIERTGKATAVTLTGIPDHDMAYRLARLQYYEENFQREAYTLKTDIEGLIPKRGSLVYIQSDVIDVGLGSGRITRILDPIYSNNDIILSNSEIAILETGGGVGLDETLDLIVGEDYAAIFRNSSGELSEPKTFTYAEVDGRSFFLGIGEFINSIEIGDFAAYGTLDNEIIPAIVSKIEYTRDLECTLTLVNYDEELYNIDEDPDQDPIPEFETGLNDRVEFVVPNPPELTTLDGQAGINISKQQFYLDIEYPSQLNNDASSYAFQMREVSLDLDEWIIPGTEDDPEYEDPLDFLSPDNDIESDWGLIGTIPAGQSLYTYQGIERGTAYRVRARTRGVSDLFSAYSEPVNIIVPFSFPPQPVTGLEFTDTVAGIELSWDRLVDPDLADYEIRTDTNVGEKDGRVMNTVSVEAIVGYNDEPVTYYVYGRTVFDSYSEDPAEITVPSFYVPTTPLSRTQTSSEAGTKIRWHPIAESDFFKPQYVDFYEVRTDELVGEDDGLVGTTSAQSFNIGYVNGNDLVTYFVYGVSVGGYYSKVPLEMIPVNPDVPEIMNPIELISVPIDNSVTLDWQEPLQITYPVRDYEVEQLAPGRVEFAPIGTFDATYANIVEREGGSYTFRVRTVDQGRNRSEWVKTQVRVFDPTDFVLFYEQDADLTEGTNLNTLQGTHNGDPVIYGPVELNTGGLGKTWNDTVQEAADETGTSFELVNWQDKYSNVGPYLPQFTPEGVDGSSRYIQVFDLFEGQSSNTGFQLIQNTSIEVNFDVTQMTPDNPVNFRTFIEWSDDEVNWNGPSEGTRVFIEDEFRFVRFTIYFDTNGDATGIPFARLNSIDIVADVKQVTDQGEHDIVGAFLENGDPNPDFPTEIPFRTTRDSEGNVRNFFIDVLSVNGTVEEFDPEGLQDPTRVTRLLSNGKIENLGEIITVKTEFEYLSDPEDPDSPVVTDKFRAYAQGPDGRFIPARISWIARGIANVIE